MIDKKTRSAIIAGMRRVWAKHPFRIRALKRAEIREWLPLNQDGSRPKRPRVYYICAKCGCRAKTQETATHPKLAVDHVIPVIPVDRPDIGFDEIVARMFIEDPLELLCGPCHNAKSTAENAQRRENKKNATLSTSTRRDPE